MQLSVTLAEQIGNDAPTVPLALVSERPLLAARPAPVVLAVSAIPPGVAPAELVPSEPEVAEPELLSSEDDVEPEAPAPGDWPNVPDPRVPSGVGLIASPAPNPVAPVPCEPAGVDVSEFAGSAA